YIFLTNRPSVLQGCYVGNADNQGNGAHTYWDGDLEGEDRAFNQDFLDRLALNCVPYPLMAAFCAWDGGRLQTYEENSAAWGGGTYPGGSSPKAGGYNDNGDVIGPAVGPIGPCGDCDPNAANWTYSYQNPPGGNPMKSWDYAYFISPPGRF